MSCKLCGGHTLNKFNLTVLDRYLGEYFQCSNCHSLQILNPYWIDEAYSTGNLSTIDHGVMQRNIDNFCIVYVFSKIFSVRKVLDFGGGSGVLTRLLRDYGVNCFFYDLHVVNSLASLYKSNGIADADLRLAFEVVEHFTNPVQDLAVLFENNPRFVIVSTELYENQGSDWPYLVPQSGQHLFFYSKKAMELIAKKNGYRYLNVGGYSLFYNMVRNCRLIRFTFLSAIFFKTPLRLLLFMLSPKGVQADVRKTKK